MVISSYNHVSFAWVCRLASLLLSSWLVPLLKANASSLFLWRLSHLSCSPSGSICQYGCVGGSVAVCFSCSDSCTSACEWEFTGWIVSCPLCFMPVTMAREGREAALPALGFPCSTNKRQGDADPDDCSPFALSKQKSLFCRYGCCGGLELLPRGSLSRLSRWLVKTRKLLFLSRPLTQARGRGTSQIEPELPSQPVKGRELPFSLQAFTDH